jgi:hypothetical protein
MSKRDKIADDSIPKLTIQFEEKWWDEEYLKKLTGKKMDKIKPEYYKAGNMDVIAFCMEHNLSFCEGNIVKYVTRWKQKNGIEDLEKAQQYLNRVIDDTRKRLESTDN